MALVGASSGGPVRERETRRVRVSPWASRQKRGVAYSYTEHRPMRMAQSNQRKSGARIEGAAASGESIWRGERRSWSCVGGCWLRGWEEGYGLLYVGRNWLKKTAKKNEGLSR